MAKPDRFRFRKLDNIGAAAAEEDKRFLQGCFVDTGDLEILSDCSDPRRLILGRTGTGKTALLVKLNETQERVIEIKPESLALSYISNSTILSFFADLGVNLNIFYKLLWRHVLTVELLKHHFKIYNEESKKTFIARITSLFKDDKHRKAIEYLEKWGREFWQETEYRIQEVTEKLESDLKASVRAGVPKVSFDIGAAQKLTEEQKQKVIHRAQDVVNKVQIRQLSDIIDLVDDVLDDPQQRYYIVIDRLDEDWVEEELRLRLIRALIETIRDFKKVRHAKVISVLRLDLLDRVLKLTRAPGFQEEKYESMYLHVDWTRKELIEVLDSRIDFLIKQRYTTQKVTHKDVLPRRMEKGGAVDFMLERTLMRPRDVIQFFNYCIQQAAGRPAITVQMLRTAEGEYSRARLRSLADEWYADYPNLMDFTAILKSKKKRFSLKEISREECEDLCLDFVIQGAAQRDLLSVLASQVIDDALGPEDFKKSLFQVFYRVGLVELKLESFDHFIGVTSGRRSVSPAELTENTKVAIHPTFWRVFGSKAS